MKTYGPAEYRDRRNPLLTSMIDGVMAKVGTEAKHVLKVIDNEDGTWTAVVMRVDQHGRHYCVPESNELAVDNETVIYP